MANTRVAIILGSPQMNEQVKNSISPSLDNMNIFAYDSVDDFISRSIDQDQLFDHVLIHENMLGAERGPVKDAESDARVSTIHDLEAYISEGRDETKIVLICRVDSGYRSGIDNIFNEEMGNPNTTPVLLGSVKVPVLVELIQSPIPEVKAKYYDLDKDKIKVGTPSDDKPAEDSKAKKKGRKVSRRKKGADVQAEEVPEDGTPETTTDDQGRTVRGEYFGGAFRALEYYDELGRLIPIAYNDEGGWYPLGQYEGDNPNMIDLIYGEDGNAYPLGYIDDQGRYVAGAYSDNGDWYATGYYDESGTWVDHNAAQAVDDDQADVGEGFSRPISREINEEPREQFTQFQDADNPSDGIPEAGSVSGFTEVENSGWVSVGAGSGGTDFLDEPSTPQGIAEAPATPVQAFEEVTTSAWGEVGASSGGTDFLTSDGEEDIANEGAWSDESNGFESVQSATQAEEFGSAESSIGGDAGQWQASNGFDETTQGGDIPSFTDILEGSDSEPVSGKSVSGWGFPEQAGGFKEVARGFAEAAVGVGSVGAADIPSIDVPHVIHPTKVHIVRAEARRGVGLRHTSAEHDIPKTGTKINVVAGTNSQGIAYEMALKSVSEGEKVLLIDAETLENTVVGELTSRIQWMASKKGIAQGRTFHVDGFDFMSNGIKTRISSEDLDWISNEFNYGEYDRVVVHVGWSGLWVAQSLIVDGASVFVLVDATENGLIEFVLEMSDRKKVSDSMAEILWNKADFKVYGELNHALVQELRTLVVVDRLDWLKKVA